MLISDQGELAELDLGMCYLMLSLWTTFTVCMLL